jgi:hypothetical protein
VNTLHEITDEAIRGLDRSPAPTMLIGLDGKILGANAEASSLFTPLNSRDDLPTALTAGLDEAFSSGCRTLSCWNAPGRIWRRALYPEYLDPQRLHQPTCAQLRLETKAGRTTPEGIAVGLYRELRDGCIPLSSYLKHPAVVARHAKEAGFAEAREQAEQYIFARTLRIADALLALVGGFGGERTEATVKSLIVEAVEANDRYHATQFQANAGKMQLIYQGSDAAFSTCNLPRLRTLLAEILVDVRRWSGSVSVLWAEDHKMLPVPALKLEFVFNQLPHILSHLTSRNEGLGWSVAAEIVLDAVGYMEIRPGKPASLRLWLPATLPEGF